MKLQKGSTYKFIEIQENFFKNIKLDNPCFIRVKDIENDMYAFMTVFLENFSSSYKSGDGVLFYEDGETHSADDSSKFEIIDFVYIKPAAINQNG